MFCTCAAEKVAVSSQVDKEGGLALLRIESPAVGGSKAFPFLSFKPGTDDLRESPMVELAERLIGKGFDVKIHDPTVVLSRLIGANRTYIRQQLPHICDLLTSDVDAVLEHGDVLIAGSRQAEVVDAINRAAPDRLVLDLVRLPNAEELRGNRNYRGISW